MMAILFAAASFAQSVDTMNIDKAIEALGKRIEAVTVLVQNSGSAEAATVLAKGVEHYNSAVELHKQGKDRAAWAELNTAAKLVSRAAAIAKGLTNLDQQIKRVGAMIEKAKVVVEKSGSEQAKRVLAEAVEHYNKAVQLQKDGKPREALVELRIAEKLTVKAVEIAKNQSSLDMQIKRVGAAIEKATPVIEKSTNERAKKLFAEGIEHYKKAVDLNAGNKTREAKIELDIAAKMVESAVKLAQQ